MLYRCPATDQRRRIRSPRPVTLDLPFQLPGGLFYLHAVHRKDLNRYLATGGFT